MIRAVEAAQLRPLLEGMANGEDICYIGIQVQRFQNISLKIWTFHEAYM